jgi:hypothetical protein
VKTKICLATFVLGALVLVGVLTARCRPTPTPGADSAAASDAALLDAGSGTTLTLANATPSDTIAFLAFGTDSVVVPALVPLCGVDAGLTCQFPIKARSTVQVPLASQYINATVAFGAAVGCGSTKAELNLNNPKWYDILDVSLVDGFSNGVEIGVVSTSSDGGTIKLGPPNGATGNERVYGLFPLGCDICTARQAPPCGIVPGGSGCKAGTQYKPDVPCQWQGTAMGGGGAHVTVSLVGIPMAKKP